ncbi:hypothetical protein SmJEL517_g04528 [Synchytrium microbalum]|uniref:Dynein light intermediate chain n=1 Tax=Synchytrium microbalum TaxID=1806994 RepID=A0A507BZM3_9FUNG|nr:uncharacterized protein SmJEL517_g04528 [Synchytrium microbalum]TPX32319.1 hypothetical protein SmJEL517_g04528 [Synchytrium microbalum]
MAKVHHNTHQSQSTSSIIPDDSLWSSILSSTLASKSIPSRNILLVGDAQSGKTTIVQHLRQDASQSRHAEHVDENAELALSYTFFDVKDEDEVAARVGIYQLATHAAYGSLIKFGLTASTLDDSLIVLVLDWTRPWSFVETLLTWLGKLEDEIEELTYNDPDLLANLREKVETSVRSYTEPGEVTSSQHNVLLPLGPGSLARNLGVPIVVVCNKADVMTKLERDYKEESFDYIQQTLRTICLKYGASLFYVSKQRPETLSNLRSYILYQLESQPKTPSTTATSSFPVKAQVVERDVIFIPSGWDSWGKIKTIKESFDCSGIAGLSNADSITDGEGVARKMYEDVIKRPHSDIVLTINTAVEAEDEQVFLERLSDQLGMSINSSALPPSGLSADPPSPRRLLPKQPSNSGNGGMGSESLDDVSVRLSKLAKRPEKTALGRRKSSEQSETTGANLRVPASVSDLVNTTSGPMGASQNEVLATFFQNLLNKKSTGPSSSTLHPPKH